MKEFSIKRSKWLRGNSLSSLLNSEGNQCCLGFFCSALGIPDEDILYKSSPCMVASYYLLPQWAYFFSDVTQGLVMDTSSILNLININDNLYLEDNKRERLIKEAFSKHNISVKFED